MSRTISRAVESVHETVASVTGARPSFSAMMISSRTALPAAMVEDRRTKRMPSSWENPGKSMSSTPSGGDSGWCQRGMQEHTTPDMTMTMDRIIVALMEVWPKRKETRTVMQACPPICNRVLGQQTAMLGACPWQKGRVPEQEPQMTAVETKAQMIEIGKSLFPLMLMMLF